MNENIIELKNVNFTNVNYKVLDDINLKIKKNTFTTIIGKSGSGKSTLLKIMAGILTPDNGIVKIKNKDINNIDEKENIALKKEIGFVFQDVALLSNLSIKENLALPLEFHFKNMTKDEIEDKIVKILNKVTMLESLNERPAQLSLGEQKLVGIARAMITEPDILYLDESLASIDPTIFKKMLKLIGEYSELENTTIIAVTHSKNMILKLSDRIILIDNKTIIIDKLKTSILKMSEKERPEIINDIFGS